MESTLVAISIVLVVIAFGSCIIAPLLMDYPCAQKALGKKW